MPPAQPIKNPWLTMATLSKLTDPTPYYSPDASYDASIDPFAPNAQAAPAPDQLASQGPQPQAPQAPQAPDPLLDRLPMGNGSGLLSGRMGVPGNANFAQFDQMMKDLRDKGVQSQKDQADQLQTIAKYVNALPDSAQMTDLTGLNSLADAWGDGKSNFAGNYQHPQTTLQAMQAKMAALGDLDKLQNNLSKDQLASLQDQLRDELGKQTVLAHWGMINANKAGLQDDKVLGHLQDLLQKDKTYASAQGMLGQAGEIQDLIQQAQVNPAAKNELAIKMALFFNGGQRLNMPEIQAQGGSQKLIDRFNQMIQTGEKGTLSAPNAKYMSDLITRMGSQAGDMANLRAVDFANMARARTSYDPQTAFEKLTGRPYQMKQPTRTAPSVAPLSLQNMTPEQMKQYLRETDQNARPLR